MTARALWGCIVARSSVVAGCTYNRPVVAYFGVVVLVDLSLADYMNNLEIDYFVAAEWQRNCKNCRFDSVVLVTSSPIIELAS